MVNYIKKVPGAPEAIGPYSIATVTGNFAFLSGQIPVNPETGEVVEGDVTAQTEQVMKNLLAVLGHLNVDFNNVVKTTIYLTDLNNYQAVNTAYAKWIGVAKPARATVQVSALPRGVDVEIDAIAVLDLPQNLMFPYGSEKGAKGAGCTPMGCSEPEKKN